MNATKNQTLKIDCSIIDYWMRELNHTEFKMLLVIYRKTEVLGKPFERISQIEISNITGMTTRSIRTAQKSLEDKGLIKTKGGIKSIKNYSLNMNVLYNVCLNIDNFGYKIPATNRVKIPQSLRIEVFENDYYRCKQCGTHKGLEIDHIVPVSSGGDNEIKNLQTLCGSCNFSKGTKAMEDWVLSD